jgi:diguanylate cyclase (GGDEF)-like protein
VGSIRGTQGGAVEGRMQETRSAPRALVIDAEAPARALAAQALRAADFVVFEAADGGGALAQLPRVRPALVIVDAELPGRDGISLCEAIRHLPSGAAAAIVLTTQLDRPGLIERAFAAGASDFLRKPVDPQLLAYRARFLVRSNETQRTLRTTLAELEQSRASLADAHRIARIGSWQWTPATGVLFWSEHAERIVKLAPAEAAGVGFERYLACVHRGDVAAVEKAFATTAADGTPLDSEHRVLGAGGGERIVHLLGELQWNVSGEGLLHGTVQDVTQRRESEERIHQLANYDLLTSLPNRAFLFESLERAIARARAAGEQVAVIALGLDRFRRINDAYGQAFADELLRRTAKRIASCARGAEELSEAGEAVASRVAGDEFMIAVGGITGASQVEGFVRRLLHTTSRPFSCGRERAEVSATAGIALYPEDGLDASRLTQNAVTAMQQAKHTQRGEYRFYSAQLSSEAARSLEVERVLRDALASGEGLYLEYQPQVSSEDGRWLAVEALVRMRGPGGEVIPPAEFISTAEDTGLILPLGEWVLNAACRAAHDWSANGSPLRIAVNVSSHQLRSGSLVEVVRAALTGSGLPPQRLDLEITESAFVEDLGAAAETLAALRRMGVRISLDDFGTGFSTLSNLMRLPIDALKIDRSFVRCIETEDHARAVIAAVIGIAYRLGLTVVAEGVEHQAQASFLLGERCQVLQGYLHGKPMPREEIEARLARAASP